jgi:hypothetical protein
MRSTIEVRIGRAVDGALEAAAVAFRFQDLALDEPCAHRRALAELVTGETDEPLVEVFAQALSWHVPREPWIEDASRWVDTTELFVPVYWPKAISREPSSESLGLSPESLRFTANAIEQLVSDGLLEATPESTTLRPSDYQMPAWLWAAFLEVIRRLRQKVSTEERAEHVGVPEAG